MNALFFWLFSGGMIICALAVVLNRNAVASALCFTFAIVFMCSPQAATDPDAGNSTIASPVAT